MGGDAHLGVGFPVQKGYLLLIVIDGDHHTKGVRPAVLDIVTWDKIGNYVVQTDANDQPGMRHRAFSNHFRNTILDALGPADDASMLSRHHQYPITYLSRILSEAFETRVEGMVRSDHGRLHEWRNVLRGILQDSEIG